MENSIVKIEKNDLSVGTWDLSIKMNIEHRMLTRTIEKYIDDFEKGFGFIASQRQQIEMDKKGRRPKEYILDEPQAMYLLTLLTNMDRVREFKMWLTKEFFKQRKILTQLVVQKQNAEWIHTRESGKIARKEETDHLKIFVDYAKSQGSKNYKMYYISVTVMQYKSLFPCKYEQFSKIGNFRDCLDRSELNILEVSDRIVVQAVTESTKLEKPYKDVFDHLKLRTEGLAMSLGITPLRLLMKKKAIA